MPDVVCTVHRIAMCMSRPTRRTNSYNVSFLSLSALHVSDSLVHHQERRFGAVYRHWYMPVPYVWLLCGYRHTTARRTGLYQMRCTDLCQNAISQTWLITQTSATLYYSTYHSLHIQCLRRSSWGWISTCFGPHRSIRRSFYVDTVYADYGTW